MKLSLYRDPEFWLFAARPTYGFNFVTERFTLSGLISERRVFAHVPAALVQILVLVIIVVVISPIPIGSGAT